MENRLTSGPVLPALVRFMLPMILTGLLQQSYVIVDSIILGNCVGEHAIGSITCSYVVIDMFLMILIGLASGCTIQTAHLVGRGEADCLSSLAKTGMLVVGTAASICSVLGVFLSTPALRLLDTPSAILNTSSQYLSVAMLGLPFIGLYNLSAGLLRGTGNSRVPLYGIMISSSVNIALDLLFVSVFRWGIIGAAIATVSAQALSACYLVFVMARKINLMRSVGLNWRLFGEGVRLGLPQIALSGLNSLGRVLLQDVMNSFGAVVVNGVGTAYKLDSVIMIPLLNATTAVAVFTGQNESAGDRARTQKGLRCGIALNTAFSLFAVLLVLVMGKPLIGIFGVSSEVSQVAYTFLTLCASFYVFFGIGNAFSGYLQGIKDVMVASLIACTAMGVRVLLNYLLRPWIGWYVVAVAEMISWVVSASMYFLRYRRKTKSHVDG